MTGLGLGPRVEDGADRAEEFGQVGGLLLQQGPNVRAGRITVSALRDDRRDLRERQPKAASLRDEAEHAEYVRRVHAVARRGTPGARDDAARLVQADRLAGDPAPLCHVTNEQAFRHATRIDL